MNNLLPPIKKTNNINVLVVGAFANPYSTNLGLADGFEQLDAVHCVKKYDYRTRINKGRHTLLHNDLTTLANCVDLMVICKGGGIPTNTIKVCSTKTKTYLWFMDWWPQVLKTKPVLEYSPYCHYRSATGYGTAMEWQNNINLPVYHILDGVDPNRMFPMEKTRKIFDVCFVGQKDSEREIIEKHLIKSGFKVHFAGPKFTKYMNLDECCELFNKSKIVLNISRGNIEGYSSVRLWSCLSTGACVLTKKIPNMTNTMNLKNGVHIDEFGSMVELVDKVNYYLKNEDKRNELGNNAREFVLNNRTWKHVAGEILNLTKSKPSKLNKI